MPQVLDKRFEVVGEGALDNRKRVTLTKAVKLLEQHLGQSQVRFEIAVNSTGQILLSPSAAIPAHELWLYNNSEALAQVRQGLEQASRGEITDRGSFAEYAED